MKETLFKISIYPERKSDTFRLVIIREEKNLLREKSITKTCLNIFTTKDLQGFWEWSTAIPSRARRVSKRLLRLTLRWMRFKGSGGILYKNLRLKKRVALQGQPVFYYFACIGLKNLAIQVQIRLWVLQLLYRPVPWSIHPGVPAPCPSPSFLPR